MTDKLKMVEKGGKKVPFYAADGVGKMQSGGMPDMQYLKQMRKRNAKAQQVARDSGLAQTGRKNRKPSNRGMHSSLVRRQEQFGLNRPSRRQRRSPGDAIAMMDGRDGMGRGLPTIGMRDAEGGSMMRDQFERQGRDIAQRRSKRRSGPGMFGDRRLGGMFSGNRARRGGLRPSQRAVMQGIGVRGPRGIREGGLVKIASEKSNAKTRKMERRGYGAARKP
tara:strand:- start:5297 stop:5959 length:663 start_codon:yes stop_codon:yes gene_type:complete